MPDVLPFTPEDDALFDRPAAIQAERLTLGRPRQPILVAASFVLREGSCAVLEGESLGVQAFLDAARLALPVREGSLRVLGEEARTLRMSARARLRARMAYTGPSASLAPGLTLAANIALPLRLAGVTPRAYREEMEALIEDLGLGGEAQRPAAEASPPARRAAILARCVAARPALVIGESPFAGLREPLRERATALFAAMRREGAALLLSGVSSREATALNANRHSVSGATLRVLEAEG